MVDKKRMTTAVSALEQELSAPARDDPPQSDGAQPQAASVKADRQEAAEPQLEDVAHLLTQHGLDADELKGLWEHFLEELKDLPAKKPLVTVFGAFLLGFIAGRTSRK